jgi:hypothetical protein
LAASVLFMRLASYRLVAKVLRGYESKAKDGFRPSALLRLTRFMLIAVTGLLFSHQFLRAKVSPLVEMALWCSAVKADRNLYASSVVPRRTDVLRVQKWGSSS